MHKEAMPWYPDVHFDCCNRVVDVDAHLEWLKSGNLPPKYKKALEKFYHTDDSNVILNKAFF